MIYVIPRVGFSIPDPAMAGTPDYRLPAEGREVQPSEYWTRRLRDGDVVEGTPPQTDAAGEADTAAPRT